MLIPGKVTRQEYMPGRVMYRKMCSDCHGNGYAHGIYRWACKKCDGNGTVSATKEEYERYVED